MTDLETLANWCLAKVADSRTLVAERALWDQIAGEVTAYLCDDDPAQGGLFEEPTP